MCFYVKSSMVTEYMMTINNNVIFMKKIVMEFENRDSTVP